MFVKSSSWTFHRRWRNRDNEWCSALSYAILHIVHLSHCREAQWCQTGWAPSLSLGLEKTDEYLDIKGIHNADRDNQHCPNYLKIKLLEPTKLTFRNAPWRWSREAKCWVEVMKTNGHSVSHPGPFVTMLFIICLNCRTFTFLGSSSYSSLPFCIPCITLL